MGLTMVKKFSAEEWEDINRALDADSVEFGLPKWIDLASGN